MLDLSLLLNELPRVQRALQQRGISFDAAPIEALNQSRKALQCEYDELRFHQNSVSQEIARKKRGKKPVDDLLSQMKLTAERVKAIGEKSSVVEGRLRDLLLAIPNLPHESVPTGKDGSASIKNTIHTKRIFRVRAETLRLTMKISCCSILHPVLQGIPRWCSITFCIRWDIH